MKFTQILSIGLLSTFVHGAAIPGDGNALSSIIGGATPEEIAAAGSIVKNVLGSGVLNGADVSPSVDLNTVLNALNGVAGGVITKRNDGGDDDGAQQENSEFEKRDVGVALGLAVSLLKLLGISISLGGIIN